MNAAMRNGAKSMGLRGTLRPAAARAVPGVRLALALASWCIPVSGQPMPMSRDLRPVIHVDAYLGVSVDSFAASAVNRYINPEQSSAIKSRSIGGVVFAYRLHDRAQNGGKWGQVWLYGKTARGMRSASVACDDPAVGACPVGPTSGLRSLFILRNATTLEAETGVRWEFAEINPATETPAAFYLKTQSGFLTVSGAGGDVMDVHHAALGVIATRGDYAGSYFEAGIGKSDLFAGRSVPRLKVDSYLQFPLGGRSAVDSDATGLSSNVHGFIRMTVDGSWHHAGADSIQTTFGIQLNLRNLF